MKVKNSCFEYLKFEELRSAISAIAESALCHIDHVHIIWLFGFASLPSSQNNILLAHQFHIAHFSRLGSIRLPSPRCA